MEAMALFVIGFIVICFIGVLVMFGLAGAGFAKIYAQKAKDDSSPVETVHVKVVTKRTDVSGMESNTSTSYYVTFEMPDGTRKEHRVQGRDYGLVAEGDEGNLTFQGTRFRSFERSRVSLRTDR